MEPSASGPDTVRTASDAALGGEGARADAASEPTGLVSNHDAGTTGGTLDAGRSTTERDAATIEAGPSQAGDSVCGSADENASAVLTCPAGQIIDTIRFAGYGNPSGACGSFVAGSCNAATAAAKVTELCKGRNVCTVVASNDTFGDPCNKTTKQLSIEARCVPGKETVAAKPFKGVANSPCSARTLLNVSWYYNWEQRQKEPCSDGRGGAFVPMIWGHPGAEQNAVSITSAVASFVSQGYPYVLTFNEPDNSTQSNVPVNTAITLWPSFDNPGIKVVSPGTQSNANPGQAWFNDFMGRIAADSSLRTDAIALHWYGWNAGSCDAKAAGLENYIKWAEGFGGGRPIWITEWGCLNQSAPDPDTVLKFYQGALAVFARHPRIERYAWYPWADNCALVNADGSLTALGQAYAAAPAMR
jgi:hypothetical protein